MADNVDRALRNIQEKLELLTGERSDGSRRAVLISELNGLTQDLSDATVSLKKIITSIEAKFNGNIASITDELLVRADEASALAQKITTLSAEVGDNKALVQETRRALATKTMAMAESLSTISASFNSSSAEIINFKKVYADDKIVFANDLERIEVKADKQRVFRQTTAPTNSPAGTLIVGDLWYDTDDNNKAYYWDGTSWVVTSTITIKTYRQTSAPTGTIESGSLWYDTDDNNKVYYWDGSSWVDTSDGRAGKIRVFRQTTAPTNNTTNNLIVGDLWFDTDDSNKLYYWNGTTWAITIDFSTYALTASVNDERDARITADTAIAQRVMTTSAGTSRVYAQTIAPGNTAGQAGYPRQDGDIWLDTSVPTGETSPNLKPYIWYNGAWRDNSSGAYSQYAGNAATVTQLSNSVYNQSTGLAYQWAVIGSPGLNSQNQAALILSGGRKYTGSQYTDYSKIVLSASNIEMNGSVIINGSITVNSDGSSPIAQNAVTEGNWGIGSYYAECDVAAKKAGDAFLVIGSYIGGSNTQGDILGNGGGVAGNLNFDVNYNATPYTSVPIRGFMYYKGYQCNLVWNGSYFVNVCSDQYFYTTAATTFMQVVVNDGQNGTTGAAGNQHWKIYTSNGSSLNQGVRIAVIRLSK